MGTQRLGAFPSLDNKIGIDSICYQIGEFFIDKFPVDFFKHVYIDTQTGSANSYYVENGEMIRFESGTKIDRPRLVIEAKMTGNNVEDTPQAMLRNVYQQPGAYAIEPTLRGYQLFYADPYGLEMRSNDIYKKIDLTLTIEVKSKNDQEALINILDTNIKKLYGYPIWVDVNYIIPVNMIMYLRNCIYKKEIAYINRNKDKMTTVEIQEIQKGINDSFSDLLLKYGHGDIKIINNKGEYDTTNEGNNGFAVLLNRKQRIYLKIENFEPDEGSKRGNVYEYFKMTASANFMFHNLVTFITKVPAIVRGTKTNTKLLTSTIKSYKNTYGLMELRDVYHETRDFYNFPDKNWYSLYLEKECVMENVIENINFYDFIPQHCVERFKLKEVLKMCNEQTFKRFFKIIINKDRELLTEDIDYVYDKDMNITIYNCDLELPYYIDLFCNTKWLNNMAKNIK